MLLNTNATDEQTQSIYLGETAEPAGALITYTLQSSATSPMEGTDEPTGLAQVGPPAPGYYLPLETNYFVWLLPLASMTVMDIQLSSELSEPRNLVGHVVCPETSMPLRSVTVDALVDGDVAASATTNDFGVYEFRGLDPGQYVVRVNAPGYQVVPATPSVYIATEGTYALSFDAYPSITGTVKRYSTGLPVAGAVVWVWAHEYKTVTDASGYFTLLLPRSVRCVGVHASPGNPHRWRSRWHRDHPAAGHHPMRRVHL